MYVLQNTFNVESTLARNMNSRLRYNKIARANANIIGYEYFIVQLVNQKHQKKVVI